MKNLRIIRKQKHFTQESLAMDAGLSRETIHQYETDKVERPRQSYVDKLCEVLDCTEYELTTKNKGEIMDRPKMKRGVIDLTKVIEMFETTHDDIESGKWHEDNDDVHFVYEAVAQAIYGKDYFDWLNAKTNA